MIISYVFRFGVLALLACNLTSLVLLPWVVVPMSSSIPVPVPVVPPTGGKGDYGGDLRIGLLRCFSETCKVAEAVSSKVPPGIIAGSGKFSPALRRASMWTAPLMIAAACAALISLVCHILPSHAKLYSREWTVGRRGLQLAWISCALYLGAPVAYVSCLLERMIGTSHFASGFWLAFASSILCTFLIYLGTASTVATRKQQRAARYAPEGEYEYEPRDEESNGSHPGETTRLVNPTATTTYSST